MNPTRKEIVRRAIEPIFEEEAPPGPEEMAEGAAYSRFHFHRMFKSVMGEAPGELRRRLLLERAAYQLANTRVSITEIAFEAGYGSLEGFGRSFRQAFGMTPSAARREKRHWLLHAPNDVHFRLASTIMPGETMDLLDRLLEHDLWLTRRMLECAAKLSDDQLDAPLATPSQAVSFEPSQKSIRDLLDRIVFGKEVWVAALESQSLPEGRDRTPAGMLKRLEIAFSMFMGLVRKVRDEGKWDLTFVDELCEPPETFTFGGMAAHVMTFGVSTAVISPSKRCGLTASKSSVTEIRFRGNVRSADERVILLKCLLISAPCSRCPSVPLLRASL